MGQRKPAGSDQDVAARKHSGSMVSSENAELDALVCALRVSLQAVICGLIFNYHRTTMIHKNKTTSNRLMTHWPINIKLMEH